jgi:hypothetical protein
MGEIYSPFYTYNQLFASVKAFLLGKGWMCCHKIQSAKQQNECPGLFHTFKDEKKTEIKTRETFEIQTLGQKKSCLLAGFLGNVMYLSGF